MAKQLKGRAIGADTPTMSAPRILVADDSRAVTLLIERSLQSMGWEIVTVHDGMQALVEGLTGKYDLAFLDHFMPVLLGAEILERWHEAGLDLPTIILSGLDDADMAVRCLELGAVDFLRKPFNTKELQVRAKVQLARRLSAAG